eukprot:TRINITY_DN467_c0_g1_i2.p1 TRINITY_DN467_c0_g1~~TRINITY_DN467_c0_g1_i2.p1  ORF type:complete len:1382 (+),score=373.23 TRINITY_DN467_c0_g1_i2:80-4147(+)
MAKGPAAKPKPSRDQAAARGRQPRQEHPMVRKARMEAEGLSEPSSPDGTTSDSAASPAPPAAAPAIATTATPPPPTPTPPPPKEKRSATASAADAPPAEEHKLQQWTGKTPKSLLYEFCQRQKWAKPAFHTVPGSGHGCRARCVVNDLKTKDGERIFETPEGYPTALEAQHHVAAITLYHISGTPHYRLMDTEFKNTWLTTEAQTKEGRKLAKGRKVAGYGEILPREDTRAAAAKREAAALARKQVDEETAKVREVTDTNAPLMVSISDRCRVVVEEALRKLRNGQLLRLPAAEHTASVHARERQSLESRLVGMGFSLDHARSAVTMIEQPPSSEHALDWLCLNLKDNEMPSGFGRENHMEFVQHKQDRDIADMPADEQAAMHLARFGFHQRWSLWAARMFPEHDSALLGLLSIYTQFFLQEAMAAGNSEPPLNFGPVDHSEERDALQSIFDDLRHHVMQYGDVPVSVYELSFATDGLDGHGRLVVYVSSDYPTVAPLTLIHHDALAEDQWLAAMHTLANMAFGMRGEMMLFSLITWVTQSLGSITGAGLSHPPLPVDALPTQDGAQTAADHTATSAGKPRRERGDRGPRDRARMSPKVLSDEAETKINEALYDELKERQANSKYQQMLQGRCVLPAYVEREKLLRTINSNQVTVICGDTGCGKSTQVPQLLLDDMVMQMRGARCQIMVTQPRRVAALSLAARVADERAEAIGGSVGYQIRGEQRSTAGKTRLLFCTTGILLRMLSDQSALRNVSHVIVDEVHERSVDSDFLLIILKRLLAASPQLKIVLMSATVDVTLFSNYFHGAPVVTIPGRIFPVDEFFLEEVVRITGYEPDQSTRVGRTSAAMLQSANDKSAEAMAQAADAADHADSVEAERQAAQDKAESKERINVDLLEQLCVYIHRNSSSGAVLIFMPGIMEITDVCRRLQRNAEIGEHVHALPLHSSLTPQEQRRVFLPAPDGKRKFVVATNIAETSITIDDIVYVIDTGKVKETQYDPQRHLSILMETWVSKASAKQRKGRAGRVRKGVCYRLFSRRLYERLDPHTAPEMCRTSLHQLCLQVKLLQLGMIAPVLFEAISAPEEKAILAAVALLVQVGALTHSEDLTPLGRHLAQLPVDVRIGILALYGCMLRCADTALTIAAVMSTRSPFMYPLACREEAAECHRQWATGKSDHIAAASAYSAWVNAEVTRSGRAFAEENFISDQTMRTAMELKQQLAEELSSLGFLPPGITVHKLRKSKQGDGLISLAKEQCEFSLDGRVVRAVLCAALGSNLVRVVRPQARYHAVMGGAVQKEDKARQLKLFTKDHTRVYIHPQSLNFDIGAFNSPWLVYFDKAQTSKIFVRDTYAPLAAVAI